jgi:hypothetical protein
MVYYSLLATRYSLLATCYLLLLFILSIIKLEGEH